MSGFCVLCWFLFMAGAFHWGWLQLRLSSWFWERSAWPPKSHTNILSLLYSKLVSAEMLKNGNMQCQKDQLLSRNYTKEELNLTSYQSFWKFLKLRDFDLPLKTAICWDSPDESFCHTPPFSFPHRKDPEQRPERTDQKYHFTKYQLLQPCIWTRAIHCLRRDWKTLPNQVPKPWLHFDVAFRMQFGIDSINCCF